MVHWINKHKTSIQTAVALVGFGLVLLLLYDAWSRGTLTGNSPRRLMQRTFDALAKPAELGLFALIGVYVMRAAFKWIPLKDVGRATLRLLQVIHIPLAAVVLTAAAVHGGLFVWFLWKSDFHYWSGVAALAGFLVVGAFGLVTVWKRKSRVVHLATAIGTLCLALVHIFTV